MVSRRSLLAIVLLAVAVPTGYYLVSPLFINVTVREEAPGRLASSFTVVAMGGFVGADDFHKASGVAKLVRTVEGSYLIRLEAFQVTNGPDLFVYLASSTHPSGGFLDLGRLKGNIGDQNYEIPRGMNPESYGYVLIWCRAFSTLFGHAQLVKA